MDKIQKVAELCFIKALPKFIINDLKPGREKNLVDRLEKAVDISLAKSPQLTWGEMREARNRMAVWGKETGWYDKEKHITTLISFLLAMIEESQFTFDPKIIECLNNLFEYVDRKYPAKTICMVAGGIANDKWRSISR